MGVKAFCIFNKEDFGTGFCTCGIACCVTHFDGWNNFEQIK